MRTRAVRLVASIALALAAPVSGQIRVPSTPPPQTRAGGNITARPPSGPAPRKANGQPDLAGVWLRRAGIANITQLLPQGEKMPFLPETLRRMRGLKSRPAADELQPTWQGHSIGRWEGGTLVVDTVGFNDLTWFDNYGHLHSDRMHVVERSRAPTPVRSRCGTPRS